MSAAQRRHWGRLKIIVIGLLMSALVSTALAPPAAAWCPPPISQVDLRHVDEADDVGFGETHKIGPQSEPASHPLYDFWMKVLQLTLNAKRIAPQQLQVTETSTDATLTGQSDSSSRTANCR
jgi:hypothetical protein